MVDATTELVVFTVTPEAIARIMELRTQEEDPASLALRVEVTGTNGVEYAYDLTFDPIAEATADDALYHQGELPVTVPAESIDKLQGATLDVPAGGGAGLVLRNPNRPHQLEGKHLELTGSVAEQAHPLLDQQINP